MGIGGRGEEQDEEGSYAAESSPERTFAPGECRLGVGTRDMDVLAPGGGDDGLPGEELAAERAGCR